MNKGNLAKYILLLVFVAMVPLRLSWFEFDYDYFGNIIFATVLIAGFVFIIYCMKKYTSREFDKEFLNRDY